MKRVYSFICLIIGALLIGVSCNDYLDTVPDNRTALDSDEKLNELLNGSYPECHFWVVGELASDNVTDNGSRYEISYDVLQQAYGWEEITDIQYDTPFRMWDRYYFAIGAANQVIKYIEEKGSPSHLNPQLAEALLLRAYCHFNLANVFCQPYCSNNLRELGIPYVTQPETVVITKPSREQVGIVYDKINADIERALPMVSDEGLTVPQFRFNRRAAYAFAARFNLYYLPDDVIAIDEEGAVTTDLSIVLIKFTQ